MVLHAYLKYKRGSGTFYLYENHKLASFSKSHQNTAKKQTRHSACLSSLNLQ